MTTPRTALLIAMVLMVAALVVPGSAAAARACAPEHDHPVHSLYVFNDARCEVGSVVAHRLARRFAAPGAFAGSASQGFILQRDLQGRRWKCQWNDVGPDSDVVSWSCGRRPSSLISWTWRAERPAR